MDIFGVGESVRAINGVLDTRFGRFVGAVRANVLRLIGSELPTDLPWIGSSLQLWIAEDGCRALVAMHNTFPRYEYFVDGWKVDWANAPEPNIRKFDGYQIDVEWRDTLAFALHRAMENYPIHSRYPGGCTYGWWRAVDDRGALQWCDGGTPLTYVDFGPHPRSPDDWWEALEEYVRTVRRSHRERNNNEEDNHRPVELEELWKRLGAEHWRCLQFRRQG